VHNRCRHTVNASNKDRNRLRETRKAGSERRAYLLQLAETVRPHLGHVGGNVPVRGCVLPWIRPQASEGFCCLEGEPELRHVFRTIQASPGQFFDATHPVDEGLFVHVEIGGRALPGAVLREEHLQRGGESRVVSGVVVEDGSEEVLDDAARLAEAAG
jgi:hypothetical protein